MSMAHQRVFECTEVGIFGPQMRPVEQLEVGGVGYVIANIKSLGDIDVGDTITAANNPAHVALPGYRKAVPMVYCGLYPNEGAEYRRSARRAREAQAQRRRARVRAGDVGGLGLRIPVRILGPAAHGDRAGAARTRLRARSDRDLAVGGFSRDPNRRQRRARSTIRPSCRRPASFDRSRNRTSKRPIITPPDYVGSIMDITQNRRGTWETWSTCTTAA